MKLDATFYRVRLFADVADEVLGEVYIDSDLCKLEMHNCTIDEALPELLVNCINCAGNKSDMHLRILRECQEALMNQMETQNYRVKIYQEYVDNCIQLCADVIICALI